MLNLENTGAFEKIIGYTFKDRELLLEALTHPSYPKQHSEYTKNYQRLEFLGDAILDFVITEELYELYPQDTEGQLANYRAALVNGAVLGSLASDIKAEEFIRLSDAEYNAGGNRKESILEDVLEALIGAIYLDGGMEETRQFILKLYGEVGDLLERFLPHQNPKGQLQEFIHQKDPDASLRYEMVGTEGPDHMKRFTVEVYVDDKLWGTGNGSSKKSAEEKGAIEALKNLKSQLDL